jgi:surfactin synthase thioesterase subunit
MFREPPEGDLRKLAGRVASAIVPLTDLPVAIFGHSLGAWLGLEVARLLESQGKCLLWFFASGRQGPGLGHTQPLMAHLDDDDSFCDAVQTTYGGIPEEALQEPDLLELLLPVLRADLEVLESHRPASSIKLTCPLSALGGAQDSAVPVDQLEPWSSETEGAFEVVTFSGSHFYFQEDPAPLFRMLTSRLRGASTW